ncbi:MAG: hypothetical protein ACJ8M4_08500 [Chthoniobacterales bacterium]
MFVSVTVLPAEEELPKDPNEPMDIEPPLLIQEAPNRNVVYSRPDGAQTAPGDPEQIANALEKAKKNAASGERLYKSGIIAKVDAESRVLKVIRLEADLASAKFEAAKQTLALQESQLESGEITQTQLEETQRAVAAASREAEAAAAKKKQADLDAAQMNLRRQQKLLAMGSGRKAEVSRAQEKVAALQEQE